MGTSMSDSLDLRRVIPGAEIDENPSLKDQIRLPGFMQQSIGSGMEGGPSLKNASFRPPPELDGFENEFEQKESATFHHSTSSHAPSDGSHNTDRAAPEDIVRVREDLPDSLRQALPSEADVGYQAHQLDVPLNDEMKNEDGLPEGIPSAADLDPNALHELMQNAAAQKDHEHAQHLLSQQVEAQLSRLKSAVEVLRSTSQALAEQARADAVEIGFEVARHLLKEELTQSVSSVMSFAKQAMAQVGQAREIVVRLHPQDVARAEAQGLSSQMEALCTAQVQVQSAPELEVGDVELDTDLGCIDGRVETRLKAMYAALKERG